MLCETCQQREATRFLGSGPEPSAPWDHHFCEQCADEYFARTPGMNSHRGLICLSDFDRPKLYDLLEESHPEAFDDRDAEACCRGSEIMRTFLREHLKNVRIKVNEDAFDMLCRD